MIKDLAEKQPDLHQAFLADRRKAEGESHFIRDSSGIDEESSRRWGMFPLCGRGDVNTYSLFAELNRTLIRPTGRVGCIVPTGIATDSTTQHFFNDLVQHLSLQMLLDFENKLLIFPEVAPPQKFCLLTICGVDRPVEQVTMAFFLWKTEQLQEPNATLRLSRRDFELLNPNTKTCTVFRTGRDAQITMQVHQRIPIFCRETESAEGGWQFRIQAMFHMANDSAHFNTYEGLLGSGCSLTGNCFAGAAGRFLPVYEAKMVHQFDHRYNTYAGVPVESRFNVKAFALPMDDFKPRPDKLPLPRYWAPEGEVRARWRGGRKWCLCYREVTNVNTNRRTLVVSALPLVGMGHKAPLLWIDHTPVQTVCLYANLNSIAVDYAARQKVGGTSMAVFILKQLPVLPPETYAQACPWEPDVTLAEWIKPRVLELTYTAWDMKPFAEDLGYAGDPFIWDESRRAELRAELDAAFFHLYGISEADADYILESFPIVKSKDVERFGTYRTKEMILERYRAMAERRGNEG